VYKVIRENNEDLKLPIQPPLLMAIFLALALLLGMALRMPLPFPWWLRIVGGLLFLAGLASSLSAVRVMLRSHTSPDPHSAPTALVMDGPYKLTRNPIYLGYVLTIVGVPLLLGYYWGVVLAPIAMEAYIRLIIEREENYLERKFGQAYLRYKASVRRWL
jgi:protein-S-isoprenylcysteine O-methyltransferase Ste14